MTTGPGAAADQQQRAGADQLAPCESIRDEIKTKIKADAPMLTNQGNIISNGIDAELDDLRKIAFSGKDYLLQLQQKEAKETGISSLKIAYNKVFGKKYKAGVGTPP